MTDSAKTVQNNNIQSDECQLQSSGDKSHKSAEAGNNNVSGKNDILETRLQKIAEQLYNEYGKCVANWDGSKNQSAIDIAYEKIAKTISKSLADAVSQDLNQNVVPSQKEKPQEVSAQSLSTKISKVWGLNFISVHRSRVTSSAAKLQHLIFIVLIKRRRGDKMPELGRLQAGRFRSTG